MPALLATGADGVGDEVPVVEQAGVAWEGADCENKKKNKSLKFFFVHDLSQGSAQEPLKLKLSGTWLISISSVLSKG